MRYETSTYTTYDDWTQLMRRLQKRLAAEARSRKRRPETSMVLIPVPVPVEPAFDGDYG